MISVRPLAWSRAGMVAYRAVEEVAHARESCHLVVGHTDNVGSFSFNMDLSQRRAAAVVAALNTRFGIDKVRLTPVGVSFASPVAPNKTDDGRAKNRRVELVENSVTTK